MEIRYATISKTGRRHNNEDAYKVIDMPQNNLFMGIVCDGMGVIPLARLQVRQSAMPFQNTGRIIQTLQTVTKKLLWLAERLVMPSTRNPTTSAMQRWVLRWSWPALKVTRQQ